MGSDRTHGVSTQLLLEKPWVKHRIRTAPSVRDAAVSSNGKLPAPVKTWDESRLVVCSSVEATRIARGRVEGFSDWHAAGPEPLSVTMSRYRVLQALPLERPPKVSTRVPAAIPLERA
eukprot:CAMPEP_0114494474 /NCGR_PEP_ID=MMETSP0109-20121206/4673_1 /TAXON_ID=29199 /ORGANISM="Chlorarachnion reptans, Strain CCCM449" /LENGTH=117 /DNA_ID=CAMNT_0001671517 /DNA_START=762 /DNA_END=1116 /DNA_ORIENTATION=-